MVLVNHTSLYMCDLVLVNHTSLYMCDLVLVNHTSLYLCDLVLVNHASFYLCDLVLIQPTTDDILLVTKKSRLLSFGARAFSCATPALWSKLPRSLRLATSLELFIKNLSTHPTTLI